MRTKSETRREAILQAALEVFREVGFDAASMSQIAARAGGSKGTLYNYFPSKEELLLAAMVDQAQAFSDSVVGQLHESGSLRTRLQRFVNSLLSELHTPDVIKILRVAISVGGTTDVGKRFHDLSTHDCWQHIVAVLQEAIDRDELQREDPWKMVELLRCQCESGLLAALMGASLPTGEAALRRQAESIIDIFLRAYASEKSPGPDH